MRLRKGTSRFIRAVSFVTLLAVSLLTLSYMLAPKDNTAECGFINPNANGFLSEPENSIDVAIIGNSDAYSGFSPMELWGNHGYTSYVTAEGWQTVDKSYYMLKKMLKKQKLKLVILETDCFFQKSNIVKSGLNMLNASMGAPFSVFQYHDRWKNIKNFGELLKKPSYTGRTMAKGQKISSKIKGYKGGGYMVKTAEKADIPIAAKAALEPFLKLCRDNEIDLLFVELPSQSSWNYKKHNAVKEYASKNGIPFLDLNIDFESFGFDWKNDTRDGGNHLNTFGARKCTLFVGEYIKQNYNLPDHRNDKKYDDWHKDYKEYQKQTNA